MTKCDKALKFSSKKLSGLFKLYKLDWIKLYKLDLYIEFLLNKALYLSSFLFVMNRKQYFSTYSHFLKSFPSNQICLFYVSTFKSFFYVTIWFIEEKDSNNLKFVCEISIAWSRFKNCSIYKSNSILSNDLSFYEVH